MARPSRSYCSRTPPASLSAFGWPERSSGIARRGRESVAGGCSSTTPTARPSTAASEASRLVPPPCRQLRRDAARGLRAAREHGHESARPVLRRRATRLSAVAIPSHFCATPREVVNHVHFTDVDLRVARAPARPGRGIRAGRRRRRLLRARQRRSPARRLPGSSSRAPATTAGSSWSRSASSRLARTSTGCSRRPSETAPGCELAASDAP